MKYPTSGVATGTPDSTSSIDLLGRAMPATRALWLRKAWVYNATQPADTLSLYDATSSTTGAPVSTALRYKVVLPYGKGLTKVEFPSPGLKFESGCVITVDGTATGLTHIGGLGYEQ